MIDLIIILMYIALAATIGVTIWSVTRTMRIIGKTSGMVHGVPVRKISIIVTAGTLLLLILSFAFGSTAPMRINAATYTDTFWLRMANMFVFTGVTAIIVAAAATIYNFVKSHK